MRISVQNGQFCDEYGRQLLLRGVNLGGNAKLPRSPLIPSHLRDGFYELPTVSFVGRPFPLREADEHFKRLRSWGLTFVRFVITWEAVEHAGPGRYDEHYLDYLRAVVQKARQYEISLFIDPHQDVWGRFSGGSGAPRWTYEAVGFDVRTFTETGAAIIHNTHRGAFPRMIWATNYSKLAAATMFTLFFGGNDFAPATLIQGIPAQEFLQSHYINAMKQVAERLRGLDNVVGFEVMNEPWSGWIGVTNAAQQEILFRLGAMPTPLQAMAAGSGIPQTVDVYALSDKGFSITGSTVLNPRGFHAWREVRKKKKRVAGECVWRANGVWDADAHGQPVLLRPEHFIKPARGLASGMSEATKEPVDFNRDYFEPFIKRYAAEIRSVMPEAAIFVEGVPTKPAPYLADMNNIVHAAHWYDVFTLFTKQFHPDFNIDLRTEERVIGREKVLALFADQVAHFKRESEERLGGAPTLIGEAGIPFDLNDKVGYRTRDFSLHAEALDGTMQAIERNCMHLTLWNYNPDNTNAHGDGWNGEDLSVFSRDQQRNPRNINSGGRGLLALVRPYPRAIAGRLLSMEFDYMTKVFECVFEGDPSINAPTEIFVPLFQYRSGIQVEVSDGDYEYHVLAQTLVVRPFAGHRSPRLHRVRITSAQPISRSAGLVQRVTATVSRAKLWVQLVAAFYLGSPSSR
jgi:hypothetical protein